MAARKANSRAGRVIPFIKNELRNGRLFEDNADLRRRIWAAFPDLKNRGIPRSKYSEWARTAQYENAADNDAPLFSSCPIPEFNYERDGNPDYKKGLHTLVKRQQQTLTRMKHERMLLHSLVRKPGATPAMIEALNELSLSIVAVQSSITKLISSGL